MQPAQFQCGHCGQLMAVNNENLGQQVRCPHCQQIVVAPPPAPPAELPGAAEAPAPGSLESIGSPPAEDADDIFSPTQGAEDLFGRGEAPRIEMPFDPLTLPQPGSDAAPSSEIQAAPFMTVPWSASEPAEAPPTSLGLIAANENTAAPPPDNPLPWPSGTFAETLAPPPAD